MEEAVMYGIAVALLMLGVPLWHSMGECRKGRLVRVHLCRWWLLCGFMVMLSLVIAVLFGLVGFVLQNYSPPPRAVRLSTDCKVLSKGVDLRSTKVCEVGHTVHLPKSLKKSNVPSKFRCSLDYYWTSVFKVEYMPHTSQSFIQASAEVPRAALPSKCRPGFGAAWRTKENYKVQNGLESKICSYSLVAHVNQTYPCMYSPKNLEMVDFATVIAGNCTSDEPSNLDLIRQFWYLLVHSENSIFSASGKTGELLSRAAAAVGLGICYSMIVTGFTRTVCQVHFHFEHGEYSDLDVVYYEARIQLAILFTASLFGLIWLSNHYVGDDIDVELFVRELYKRTGVGE